MKTTRANLKINLGGTLIKSWRRGETYDQLWTDKTGSLWFGNDWYGDSVALVHDIETAISNGWCKYNLAYDNN